MAKPRPELAVNFATTWDGRITTRNRTPSDFSSPKDKRRMLEIRASGDALILGKGTLVTENISMGLPKDLQEQRLASGRQAWPIRVILTNSGRLSRELRVFQHDVSPILVYSTQRMPRTTRKELEKVAALHLDHADTVDLEAMLLTLHSQHGVQRAICEGGAEIFRALLKNELIDEVNLTLCPLLFGGLLAPTLTGPAGEFLTRAGSCTLDTFEVLEEECFLRYRCRHSLSEVSADVSTETDS